MFKKIKANVEDILGYGWKHSKVIREKTGMKVYVPRMTGTELFRYDEEGNLFQNTFFKNKSLPIRKDK